MQQRSRPNNVSTYIARDFPASFTPDRNFRTAGQHPERELLGRRRRSTRRSGRSPATSRSRGEGTWNETSPRNGFQWTARVDHNFNEGKDRIYASFNRTTTDKVGFGTPEVYPGFTAKLADEQHAVQHQLDADRLADRGQRGVLLLGAAVGRAREPAPRHPRHHGHRDSGLPGRLGTERASCRTASSGATS